MEKQDIKVVLTATIDDEEPRQLAVEGRSNIVLFNAMDVFRALKERGMTPDEILEIAKLIEVMSNIDQLTSRMF